MPIIEDDAYGLLPAATPPSLAEYAPALTYYICGLSKSLGAGLRTAFVLSPTERACERLAGAMRSTTVMGSPVTNAIVTAWIEQGLASEMLQAVRAESAWRTSMAEQVLAGRGLRSHPHGFHAWLPVAGPRAAAEMAAELRGLGVAAVASAAFSTNRDPPEALRLCLGGPLDRDDCGRALQAVAGVCG